MLRVIAGELRGRRLKAPTSGNVRPTTDLARGAIFSMLGGHLHGERVLDLYAGSGAMGIEALSRGASAAVFVEQHTQACRAIHDNLEVCKVATQGIVMQRAVTAALLDLEGRFDLVFVDPPYADTGVQSVLRLLDERQLLALDAIVVVEHAPSTTLDDVVGGLRLWKSRRHGGTALTLYEGPRGEGVRDPMKGVRWL